MSYFDENEDVIVWGRHAVRHQCKICDRCGLGGLRWRCDDDGWYLADDSGEQHDCDVSDAFEVLP